MEIFNLFIFSNLTSSLFCCTFSLCFVYNKNSKLNEIDEDEGYPENDRLKRV